MAAPTEVWGAPQQRRGAGGDEMVARLADLPQQEEGPGDLQETGDSAAASHMMSSRGPGVGAGSSALLVQVCPESESLTCPHVWEARQPGTIKCLFLSFMPLFHASCYRHWLIQLGTIP